MPSYPVLTPAYGLGSYGRTSASILVGSSRTKIGSQGRIYSYMNSKGLGEQYKSYIIQRLRGAFVIIPVSNITRPVVPINPDA